jgi:small subunit ribosomal protein S14
MSKTSKMVRNQQRRAVVAKYAERRAELKRLITAPGTDLAEAARGELSRQPRDGGATRLRNRDSVDGRPRGHLRAFGVSRIRMRELTHGGHLPGVRKSSW